MAKKRPPVRGHTSRVASGRTTGPRAPTSTTLAFGTFLVKGWPSMDDTGLEVVYAGVVPAEADAAAIQSKRQSFKRSSAILPYPERKSGLGVTFVCAGLHWQMLAAVVSEARHCRPRPPPHLNRRDTRL